jgi:hypothetical protein
VVVSGAPRGGHVPNGTERARTERDDPRVVVAGGDDDDERRGARRDERRRNKPARQISNTASASHVIAPIAYNSLVARFVAVTRRT